MNSKITEAKIEFENKNYKKALEILDGLQIDDVFGKVILMIRVACLRRLKMNKGALSVINSAIAHFPYESYFWAEKVEVHHFEGDGEGAAKALHELERITNNDDINELISLSGLFELVGNYEKALEYCDIALDIDGNSLDAVRQKAMIASSSRNHEMMNECADALLKLYDDDFQKLLLPFMLKLFSRNYRDCCDIVDCVDVVDDEYKEFLKSAIYTSMCDDLNIELIASGPVELDVAGALNLLFDYYYDGIQKGNVCGVSYMVVKSK